MIYLKIGSSKQKIADWHCEAPQLTFNSFSPDVFSFDTSLFNFKTAFMDFETPLEVFQDDVRVFVGHVQEPVVVKSGAGDRVTVTALGLYNVFESLYYSNSWLPDFIIGTISGVSDASKTQLFGRKRDIKYTSVGGTYEEPYFLANWSAEGFFRADVLPSFNNTDAYSLFSIPSANINFNSSLILPYEEKDVPTYVDVFQSITKWHPDLLAWFDYSSAKPALSIKAAAVCPTVDVKIAKITDVSLTKDIKRRRRVILRRILYVTGITTGFWRKHKGFVDVSDTGVYASQRNALIIPIDTTGDNYSNETIDLTALHAQLKSIVNMETYSGSATILDRDLSNRYVGKRLNVKGSRDSLDSISASIQSDTIDLVAGTRTLTLGATNQPDCQDFVSRIEWMLSAKRSNMAIQNSSGTTEEPDPDPGDPDPDPTT